MYVIIAFLSNWYIAWIDMLYCDSVMLSHLGFPLFFGASVKRDESIPEGKVGQMHV